MVKKSFVPRTKETLYAKKKQKYKLSKIYILPACSGNTLLQAEEEKKKPTKQFRETKCSSEETKGNQVLNV